MAKRSTIYSSNVKTWIVPYNNKGLQEIRATIISHLNHYQFTMDCIMSPFSKTHRTGL